MTDRRLACRFAALSLAMRAKNGPLWRPEIERLQDLAAPLDAGDCLQVGVVAFVAAWSVDRWDAVAMAEAGAALIRAVERAGWPEAAPQGAT